MTSLFPGLTWQDDITQQVISRELSKLRRTPLRHQATPPSPLTAYRSSRDRKLRPSQAELNRNLQQYLTGLGFLPQSEVNGQPGIHRDGANVQVRVTHCRVVVHHKGSGRCDSKIMQTMKFSLLFMNSYTVTIYTISNN